MPRFFFDIHDSGVFRDDTGSDLADLTEVRQEALRTLPRIAADEIPVGGDRRHFTVIVRDETGIPVYSATLSFVGMWLGLEKPHVATQHAGE